MQGKIDLFIAGAQKSKIIHELMFAKKINYQRDFHKYNNGILSKITGIGLSIWNYQF
jgi:hypothetical protein